MNAKTAKAFEADVKHYYDNQGQIVRCEILADLDVNEGDDQVLGGGVNADKAWVDAARKLGSKR